MRLTLEIEMDNAAFEECSGDECARILREVADTLVARYVIPHDTGALRDVNGNPVGKWKAFA